MRIHRASDTRVVLMARPKASELLLWALVAAALASTGVAVQRSSWVAGSFAGLCLAGAGGAWRWGGRRTIRLTRAGTLRLRDHRRLRWEYPVAEIEDIEVSGSPDEHGGEDYGVVVFIRGVGWVALSDAPRQTRGDAVRVANALRTVLEWPPLRSVLAPQGLPDHLSHPRPRGRLERQPS